MLPKDSSTSSLRSKLSFNEDKPHLTSHSERDPALTRVSCRFFTSIITWQTSKMTNEFMCLCPNSEYTQKRNTVFWRQTLLCDIHTTPKWKLKNISHTHANNQTSRDNIHIYLVHKAISEYVKCGGLGTTLWPLKTLDCQFTQKPIYLCLSRHKN